MAITSIKRKVNKADKRMHHDYTDDVPSFRNAFRRSFRAFPIFLRSYFFPDGSSHFLGTFPKLVVLLQCVSTSSYIFKLGRVPGVNYIPHIGPKVGQICAVIAWGDGVMCLQLQTKDVGLSWIGSGTCVWRSSCKPPTPTGHGIRPN